MAVPPVLRPGAVVSLALLSLVAFVPTSANVALDTLLRCDSLVCKSDPCPGGGATCGGPEDFAMDPLVVPIVAVGTAFNFSDFCIDPATQSLQPNASVPAAAGFSCTEGDQDCQFITGGGGDSFFLVGTFFPHGPGGYTSANEHNRIFDRFTVCHSTGQDRSGFRYALVVYDNDLTAGDRCQGKGGDCKLASRSADRNPATADEQDWATEDGVFTSFAPDPEVALDAGECRQFSFTLLGAGAGWDACAVKKMRLARGGVTGLEAHYQMDTYGDYRNQEHPTYGVTLRFEDPGYTMTFETVDRFYHTIRWAPNHVHEYPTTGQLQVADDRIVPV
jgi:hypothetical protein